jgi:hypothetical protein
VTEIFKGVEPVCRIVLGIDVEHDGANRFARWDTDQRIRRGGPPRGYNRGGCRGIVKAAAG